MNDGRVSRGGGGGFGCLSKGLSTTGGINLQFFLSDTATTTTSTKTTTKTTIKTVITAVDV